MLVDKKNRRNLGHGLARCHERVPGRLLEVTGEQLHHDGLLRGVVDATITSCLLVVLQNPLKLRQLNLDVTEILDGMAGTEGHDALESRRVNLGVLSIKAPYETAPGFQTIAVLDQPHNLLSFLVVLGQ